MIILLIIRKLLTVLRKTSILFLSRGETVSTIHVSYNNPIFNCIIVIILHTKLLLKLSLSALYKQTRIEKALKIRYLQGSYI